ncbi:hypothetical protein [Angustibacter aerolatus]
MTVLPRTADPIAPTGTATTTSYAGRRPARQITIRSTQMSHLMHEDLARAQLERRLQQAEQARLATYVVRVARARRQAAKARRQAEQAQLRVRLLVG